VTDPVRELEARTARAWPAREVIRVGGWECRFAGGYTGRANSVNPYGPTGGRLDESIRTCEELFHARELRPLFRITPHIDPPDLDAVLGSRGWVARSAAWTMARGDDDAPAEDPELEIRQDVPSEWLRLLSKWNGIPAEHEPLHRAILEAIRPERAFALIRRGGQPVACGLAVCEPPWTGLFDLVTHPERRREGIGARLVTGLLGWGAARGGRRAYLQVEVQNEPAIRLYRHFGFRHAYRYWYRVSTEESPYRFPKSPD
jgi:ribosomal protein S18 acetylase RimI-like enzyme